MPLGEIFSLYGQSGYRAIERRTLARGLSEHDCAVLSVGGGVASAKETFEYRLSHCSTFWIKAQPQDHRSRAFGQGAVDAMAGNDQALEDLRVFTQAHDPR